MPAPEPASAPVATPASRLSKRVPAASLRPSAPACTSKQTQVRLLLPSCTG